MAPSWAENVSRGIGGGHRLRYYDYASHDA